MSKIKILLASKNPGKLEAVSLAFAKFYDDFDIIGIAVSSGVSKQPVNKEIYKGALNRCYNLRKYAQENNIDADYYVAVEAGITNLLGAWVNLNLVYIENSEKENSTGISQGYPFPEKYLTEIINDEFGKVMDKHYNLVNSGQGKSVEYLFSKGNISRIDLVRDATILALTKFINEDIW